MSLIRCVNKPNLCWTRIDPCNEDFSRFWTTNHNLDKRLIVVVGQRWKLKLKFPAPLLAVNHHVPNLTSFQGKAFSLFEISRITHYILLQHICTFACLIWHLHVWASLYAFMFPRLDSQETLNGRYTSVELPWFGLNCWIILYKFLRRAEILYLLFALLATFASFIVKRNPTPVSEKMAGMGEDVYCTVTSYIHY